MSQQVFDIDTVGYNDESLGSFFDFYVNNTFYLLAPEYYYPLYAIYYNRCLSCYDGWVNGFHNKKSGLVPQRMLQSIATGLNNMLFAHGIDFSGDGADYNFAIDWAKKTKFYKALKKCHKFAIAGGTSLLKVNRVDKDLYVTAHRIDTFFADIDASGKVTSVKVFFDAIHNTNPSGSKSHFGICEERYFNYAGKPCVMASVYKSVSNIQTEVQNRQNITSHKENWNNLPPSVKQYIKDNYPSIMIDEEQFLPFPNSLGCYLMRFTDDIPQIPNTPFGQPIGDILWTENFQFDQMKYFEKNEVDLARARALVPEEMWNKDDPEYDSRALNERFYQKVSSFNSDKDKITPIQFLLRGTDIKTQKENIYKDCAFKLNVSASSLASFLSEGAGARTATEIIGERTKSDTWLDGQINLNAPDVNIMLKEIMYYYNHGIVEIIFKSEDQSPFIDKLKINSDVFGAGNMSARRFVKDTYKNLSQTEQEDEIRHLENTKMEKSQMEEATIQSWNK
ncbi:MAG: hypothetical protein RR334_03675 [Clostridia bacterium]